MNDDLAGLASRLTEPAPPSTLLPAVMARVAREADAREAAMSSGASRVQDGALVTGFVAGLVAVAGVTLWAWLPSSAAPGVWSPRILAGPAGVIGVGDPAALPFVLGLVLYLFVLFAPLRARHRA